MDELMKNDSVKKITLKLILFISILFCWATSADLIPSIHQSSPSSSQQKIKVINYILNILESSQSFHLIDEQLNYCLIKPNAQISDDLFEQIFFREKIVRLKNLNEYSQAQEQCDVVHFADGWKADHPKILSYFQNKPILLISENVEFARLGGHISLFQMKDKFAFTLNIPSLESAGFKVDLENLDKFIIEPLSDDY